jgi:hypothetical protein
LYKSSGVHFLLSWGGKHKKIFTTTITWKVICSCYIQFQTRQLSQLGLKKYLWFQFPTDPIFFCRPYYFFNAIDRVTLFSPGGCGLLIQRAKMTYVVRLIIEPNCLNSSIGNTHL